MEDGHLTQKRARDEIWELENREQHLRNMRERNNYRYHHDPIYRAKHLADAKARRDARRQIKTTKENNDK